MSAASEETLATLVRNFDVERLRAQYRASGPVRFICIDDFLEPAFAHTVAAAYPSFERARAQGKEFNRLNEDVKVQVTDSSAFPASVAKLHALLASPSFLDAIGRITGIEQLVADDELRGGGMHVMGPSGYLGVHVDFNFLAEAKLFRRLNILVYLTPEWRSEWGGEFELWDPKVRDRADAFAPRFNRCLVFNTTQESFHGVTAIGCPPPRTRNSFAAYYYTAEPPAEWNGRHHSTIYRARPGEWRKRFVDMPIAKGRRTAKHWLLRARAFKHGLARTG